MQQGFGRSFETQKMRVGGSATRKGFDCDVLEGSNGHRVSSVLPPWLVRTRLSVLIALLCLCGFTQAQTPVTSGSPIPITHPTWNQIIKVVIGKNGSAVLLDWANSGLYQLRPGSTTFTTIASGAPLDAAGTFWDSGMTIDAQDTIYIASRYGPSHFFRIPYNPVDGTYDFTASNGWGRI